MIPFYRGKGKVDYRQRKESSFTIQLERLKHTEMCEELAKGNASPGIRFLARRKLYRTKSHVLLKVCVMIG